MTNPHVWSLIFNLDAFNADNAKLQTDKERAQYLSGFSLGTNNGTPRDGSTSEAMLLGFHFGKSMRDKAEEFMARAVKAGKEGGYHKHKSAESRGPSGSPSGSPSGDGVPNPLTLILDPKTTDSLLRSNQPSSHEKPPMGPKDGLVLLTMPCIKGKTYPVTQATLDRWHETFPMLDPLQQAREMKFWLEENPTKQKTFSGMGKFISLWLGNEQKPGPGTRNQVPPSPQKSKAASDYRQANPEFFKGVTP